MYFHIPMKGETMSRGVNVLGVLEGILQGEAIDERGIRKALEDLYTNNAEKVRPFTKLAPKLASMLAKDFTPLLVAVYTLVNTASQNKDVQKAALEFRKNSAKQRRSTLQEYEHVGFTREEAMALLLTDIANVKAMSAHYSESLSNGLSKGFSSETDVS